MLSLSPITSAPPQFRWVDIDLLHVDQRYQRKVAREGKRRIKDMATSFDWSKFQALTVSGPDKLGDYSVIDGQHRLEAVKMRGDLDKLPCLVIDAPSVSDQARTFKGVNKDRTGVTRINIFWADVAAGDEDALRIKQICESCGLEVSRVGTGRQKPLRTVAVTTIQRCLDLDEEALVDVLKALVAAQGEVENAFRAAPIKALWEIWSRHMEEIDPERMVRVLEELDLDHKIDEARRIKETFGNKLETALRFILVRAYNKGLKTNRLPENIS